MRFQWTVANGRSRSLGIAELCSFQSKVVIFLLLSLLLLLLLQQSVASTLRTRCLEVEQRDNSHQVAFLQRLCRAQEREIQSQRKLVLLYYENYLRVTILFEII